tara:strand:- start:126 stop:617 length:492 start_codon:yes stop_codon:yes gene_type:complete
MKYKTLLHTLLSTSFLFYSASAEIDFSKLSDKVNKNYGKISIINFSGHNLDLSTSSTKLQIPSGTIQQIKTNPGFTFEKISYATPRTSKKKVVTEISTCESVTGEIALSEFDLSKNSYAGFYIGTKRESINDEEKLHCFVINIADEATFKALLDTTKSKSNTD